MQNAHVIDGKALATSILNELKQKISSIAITRKPGLATILVGNDAASAIYVANKRRAAEEIGVKSIHYELPEHTSEGELHTLIEKLNADSEVDGILVQLPLPKHINEHRTIDTLDPKKDVDGFHPYNLGELLRGTPKTVACTPLGIMHIIKSVNYDLSGKHAVVIGRSTIVGKPIAHLLLQQNATVTICHSHTRHLAEITQQADVVVAAVGKAKFINRQHIAPGAFVIDVGINRDHHNRLCGDVDFDEVKGVASYITPVPRGVGPLTIAMLLTNTIGNFERHA